MHAPPQFSCTNTPMHLQNDTVNERREVSSMESKHIHGTCEWRGGRLEDMRAG